jgi:S-adenosylmethionine:tRNA ribosyltransferase-isomerase
MKTLVKESPVWSATLPMPQAAVVGPMPDPLNFELPPALEATEPPEARGLARDDVRLMVSYRSDNRIVHSHFHDLPDFLKAGDVLVLNTSGTLNAALKVTRAEDGAPFELHLSTHLPADVWMVEVREMSGETTKPFHTALAGTVFDLPAGGRAILHTPYNPLQRFEPERVHLWLATLSLPTDLQTYLKENGFPIRYAYVKQAWPSSYYQTAYATEMGSAEMPSAGRAFTPELITRLTAQGIQIAPLILHTGVASIEDHEPPYDEFYRVPAETAQLINAAHASGRRVIAVGTTVIRALETVTDSAGVTRAGEGWTNIFITPDRGIRSVDGMLTGLHDAHATHLAMLEALASRPHLEATYTAALRERYLWHEFGDLHLILP